MVKFLKAGGAPRRESPACPGTASPRRGARPSPAGAAARGRRAPLPRGRPRGAQRSPSACDVPPCSCPRGAQRPLLTPVTCPVAQPGKVVIVLSGRYAGKKAVIVKNHDDGTAARPYGHALVLGLSKEPRKVIKKHNAKKQAKRSSIKVRIQAAARPSRCPQAWQLRRARAPGRAGARERRGDRCGCMGALLRRSRAAPDRRAAAPMVAGATILAGPRSSRAPAERAAPPLPLPQTFVKAVNYNHLMPTRYTLDVDLKGVVGPESMENSSKKTEARKVRAAAGGRDTSQGASALAGRAVGHERQGAWAGAAARATAALYAAQRRGCSTAQRSAGAAASAAGELEAAASPAALYTSRQAARPAVQAPLWQLRRGALWGPGGRSSWRAVHSLAASEEGATANSSSSPAAPAAAAVEQIVVRSAGGGECRGS
jgi:ribosomal protein L14E/L6E/L27E